MAISAAKCFPTINLQGFREFAKDANLVNAQYDLEMMEEDFKATNNVAEGSEINVEDLTLYRYQFWEMLIRCAKRKFLDQPFETNLEGAFERLLLHHVLSMHHELDISETGKQFREVYLYTLEVNDVLEYNMDEVRKLYS